MKEINVAGLTCRSIIPMMSALLTLGSIRCDGESPHGQSDASQVCGDGVIQADEVCDGSDLGGRSCSTEGYENGTLRCRSDCRFEHSQCNRCGDGVCRTDLGETAGSCAIDCERAESCSSSVPGLSCIEGRVKYLVDPSGTKQIMTTVLADVDAAADATWLNVVAYDALGLTVDPDALAMGTSEVNPRTGEFLIANLQAPATGVIALAVRLAPGATRTDIVGAMTIVEAAPAVDAMDAAAFVITAEQEQAWTTDIGASTFTDLGCDSGTGLLECGAWIAVTGYRASVDATLTTIDGARILRSGSPAPFSRLFLLDDSREVLVPPGSEAEAYTSDAGLIVFPVYSFGNQSATCVDLEPDSTCESMAFEWEERVGGELPRTITIQLLSPNGY
jgi:hypothetical protein